jgi:signal transduction histidine kinase/ActR/RegA family two-component response regulator
MSTLKSSRKPAWPADARPFGLDLSQAVFDRATRLARGMIGALDAQIVLVKDGRIWRSHDPEGRLSADDPASQAVLDSGELLWLEDVSKDPRLCGHAMVKGPPYLKFYAGAPIRLEDGTTPGVLCVGGLEPRPYDAAMASHLADLADFVADEWARARARAARAQAAKEADTARMTLAKVIDAMPISLLLTDSEMRILGASPRWLEAMNMVGRDVVGQSIYELAPWFFGRWRETYDRALRGETIRSDMVKAPKIEGGINWLQTAVAPWRRPDGEVGGLILASHNINSMVEALEKVERSEERLRFALEISDLHVWEVDYRAKELIKVGAEDTFFTEPKTYEELAADPWCTVDPRDLEAIKAQWEAHINEGAPYMPEYRVKRADGKEVWSANTCYLRKDSEDRVIGMLGSMQNITRRKQAERALLEAKEEAEAANRAKSAFLATMSHEIRTPLNGVLGMAQAMAADPLSDEQRRRLEVIRHSGETLLHILNDVLDLSKIEAGKLEMEEAEFDIAELARGAHGAFTAIAHGKGLGFDLRIERGARGRYVGDSTRVRQILYNLVSNALKFTDTGAVSVVVGRKRGMLELAVSDTGIGIAPDRVAKLFDKFEQADASTTRRYGGTGLGLSICRELVHLMDGTIGAESVEGAGSVFTARLPLTKVAKAKPAAATTPAAEAAHPETRALRVLAAEDNPVNQLVLKALMGQAGIEPVCVDDGAAAVAAWEAEPWDVILMDVQMPVMDGPTATGVIRQREAALGRARTPIIALTANAMSHQVSEYLAAGMDAFVAKPIEVARLFAALEEVLAPVLGAEDVAAA